MKLLAASKLHPKLNSCVYCIAMSGHSLPHNCPPCGNMLYSCPSSITAIKLLFICDKIDENRNINIIAHQYCYIQKCVIGIMSVKTRSYLDMTWTWVECNKIWHSFDDWLIFENWHPAHPYPPTLYSSFNTGVTGRGETMSSDEYWPPVKIISSIGLKKGGIVLLMLLVAVWLKILIFICWSVLYCWCDSKDEAIINYLCDGVLATWDNKIFTMWVHCHNRGRWASSRGW